MLNSTDIQTGNVPAAEQPGVPLRSGLVLFALSVAVAVAIGVPGWLYLRHVSESGKNEIAGDLAAIADLKAGQIQNWRRERLGDAGSLYDLPVFVDLVGRSLHGPSRQEARRDLGVWMEKIRVAHEYHSLVLLYPDHTVHIATRGRSLVEGDECIGMIHEAINRGEPLFADLHASGDSTEVHMSVIVPLYARTHSPRGIVSRSERPGRTGPFLGTMILVIDPNRFLYPLVQSFPIPSRTSETLLVRREGDEVVFLNELRHRRNTALRLRMEATALNLPAAMAIRGSVGVKQGLDYRHIPVVAALRPIPDSPWFIVAKVDEDELYGGLYKELRITIVALSLLSIAGVFGLLVVWRRRETQFLRKELDLKRERLDVLTRFESLMKGANDAILILDLSWRILDSNDRALRLYGFTRAEMLTMSLIDLRVPEVRAAFQTDVQAADTADGVLLETLHCRKDGTEFPVESSIRLVESSGEPVRLVIIRDITDRKRAEAAMAMTLEDLARSNKELEQFAYVASHDLQEPLRMVSSYTQLLAVRYKGQLDHEAEEFIEFAVDGANRMQRLIQDLLAYSRVQTRGRPFASVDANELLGEALLNLQIAVQESGALVTADALPWVKGDRSQLVQVFQNLIGNALKFRKPDVPPLIHISARRTYPNSRETHESGGTQSRPLYLWTFSVRDNGIGIEERFFDRIFEIFKRLHSRQSYPGTGIGLAFCARVIARHGGCIWVESVPEEGSTFHFTLPRDTDTAQGDLRWQQTNSDIQ